MAEERHQLLRQVRGPARKSCPTVSCPQQWLQLMLRWDVVSHSVVGQNRRGISVEELQAHVQEQQREQERQKAIEAEARRAVERPERVPEEKGGVQAPAQQVHRPPGLSVRKDGSPIKVRPCLRFSLHSVDGGVSVST
jgi:hypothetical protein